MDTVRKTLVVHSPILCLFAVLSSFAKAKYKRMLKVPSSLSGLHLLLSVHIFSCISKFQISAWLLRATLDQDCFGTFFLDIRSQISQTQNMAARSPFPQARSCIAHQPSARTIHCKIQVLADSDTVNRKHKKSQTQKGKNQNNNFQNLEEHQHPALNRLHSSACQHQQRTIETGPKEELSKYFCSPSSYHRFQHLHETAQMKHSMLDHTPRTSLSSNNITTTARTYDC